MYEAEPAVQNDQHHVPGGGEDQEAQVVPHPTTVPVCRMAQLYGDSLESGERDTTGQLARVLLRLQPSWGRMQTKML